MLRLRHVACAAAMMLAARSAAQSTRLCFENPPAPGAPQSGIVVLSISADPGRRPGWARPAVLVDGRLLAVCQAVPATVRWDATRAEDGEHLIALAIVDTRAVPPREMLRVDEILVTTRRPATAQVSRTSAALQRPERIDPSPARAASSPPSRDTQARRGTPPEATARVAAVSERRVLAADPRGMILLHDAGSGASTPLAEAAGPVRALAWDGRRAWWAVEDGPRAVRLFSRMPQSELTEEHALGTSIPPSGLRLQPWQRGVAVLSQAGSVHVDPASRSVRPLDEALPDAIRLAPRELGVHLVWSENQALVAAVGRLPGAGADVQVTVAWRRHGEWQEAEALRIAIPAGQAAAFSDGLGRLIVACAEALVVADLTCEPLRTERVLLPPGDSRAQLPSAAVVAGGDVWCLCGGSVLRLRSNAPAEAYLPWNVPGMRAQDLAAQGSGVMIATTAGLRRLPAGDLAEGHSGFVRVRLGGPGDAPETPLDQQLAAEVAGWMGVPYKWGGATKEGADCSGFIMAVYRALGIELPHGSAQLRTFPLGSIVKDDLRFGDVLVYPGHCAIYMGNGMTAETVSGRVGQRAIWGRTGVVVRRFLTSQAVRGELPSRSGGPRTRRGASSDARRLDPAGHPSVR